MFLIVGMETIFCFFNIKHFKLGGLWFAMFIYFDNLCSIGDLTRTDILDFYGIFDRLE